MHSTFKIFRWTSTAQWAVWILVSISKEPKLSLFKSWQSIPQTKKEGVQVCKHDLLIILESQLSFRMRNSLVLCPLFAFCSLLYTCLFRLEVLRINSTFLSSSAALPKRRHKTWSANLKYERPEFANRLFITFVIQKRTIMIIEVNFWKVSALCTAQ